MNNDIDISKLLETLSKINNDDMQVVNDNSEIICNIIDDFINMDFQLLMTKYNRK